MKETVNLSSEKVSIKKNSWLVKVIILILVLALGYGGWKFYESKKGGPSFGGAVNGDNASTTAQSQAEMEKAIKELEDKIGKLIILPKETPTVATILDAKKLIAEQPFYAGAENGDQLLVYPKSQKAIIYSPSRNMLVNVGPVYFNNASSTETETTATPPTKK